MIKFMKFNTILPTGKIGEVLISADRIIAIEKVQQIEDIKLYDLSLWLIQCDGGIKYHVVHDKDTNMNDFIAAIERHLKN